MVLSVAPSAFATTGTDVSTCTISAADQVYTGTAITPNVTVTDGATAIVQGTDYTVAYADGTDAVNVGTKTVAVTGTGSYTGTANTTFAVTAKNISTATLSPIADQTVTGSALTPVLNVTDGATALVQNTDYTIAYSNNTAVGAATVTVTGIGNYTGSATANFNIVSPAASVIYKQSDNYAPYQGWQGSVWYESLDPFYGSVGGTTRKGIPAWSLTTPLSKGVTAYSATAPGYITTGSDVNIVTDYNKTDTSTTGTFFDPYYYMNNVLTPLDSTSAQSFTFNYVGAGGVASNYLFDGHGGIFLSTSPNPADWGSYDSNLIFVPSSNVVWQATLSTTTINNTSDNWWKYVTVNVPANTLSANQTYYLVIHSGTAGQWGRIFANVVFQINTNMSQTAAWSGDETTARYGNEQGNGGTKLGIMEPTPATITTDLSKISYCYYNAAVNKVVLDNGAATFKVQADGSGSNWQTTASWTTTPACGGNVKIYDVDPTANGSFDTSSLTPVASLAAGTLSFTQTNMSVDGPTIYGVNINASGLQNDKTYYLTFNNSFQPMNSTNPIKKPIILKFTTAAFSVASVADQAYTGSAVTPSLTVTSNGTTLTKDTDYTVAYSDNVNVGTATATITGIGNYTGKTFTKTFNVAPKEVSGCTVLPIADQTWTSYELTPAVAVKDGETTLTEGVDYTVAYSDNIALGTATATVTGIGNYTGTTTGTFAIVTTGILVPSTTIAPIPDFDYTGSAITPSLNITYGDTTLVEGTDYRLSYSKNINTGIATVTITGMGGYASTTTTTFNILGKDMADCTVVAIPDQMRTGSAVKPIVTVKDGDTVLTEGADYTVAYSDNINVGTATVTVTGNGGYGGTTTATFNVIHAIGDTFTSGGFTYKVISGSTVQVGDGTTPMSFSGEVSIPSTAESIGVVYSVTAIGNNAFRNCTGLTSIIIPDSVTSIGTYAFQNCTGLTSIDIPDYVTTIGDYAFYGCSGLTSVAIPQSMTSIGNYVFYRCSKVASVSIPDSVTTIGSSAFYGCTGLTSITIPGSVTTIGNSAFNGCTGFTSVVIPNSVTMIGSSAFYGCRNIATVTIPGSVVSIGSSAFYGCTGLTSVAIPDSVTSIGSSAFYGCTGLTSVAISNSVKNIGSSVFSSCTSLTTVTIPQSVTTIESSAFNGCTGLSSVIIPDSVTSLGTYAFYNCSNLTSVTIPRSVYYIGTNAFGGCAKLASVIFDGKKVTYTFPTTTTVYYTVGFYAGSLYRIASIVVPAGGTISSVPGAVIPAAPRVNGQLGAWVTETGFSLDGAVTNSFSVAYLLDLSLSSASVTPIANQTYTGSAIEPVLTVKDGVLTLVKDIDYTVAYTDNTNVGTATATVTGIGNYNGSRSATFTITPKAISETAVNPILSQVYTGSALEPTVTVTDGETVLVQGTDFTVAYADNTIAGTATVTVTGIGNYTGTTQATFEIAAKPVLTTTIAPVADEVFNGSAFEPALTVTDGDTTLVLGTDYTVAYSDNVNAGTATATITGVGNYVGTAQATFTIAAKPFSDQTAVAAIDGQVWTGSAIEPTVTVTDGETTLIAGTDYTVAYTNNIEAGNATATITGIGNYSGTLQANFAIAQETLEVAGVDRSATAPNLR